MEVYNIENDTATINLTAGDDIDIAFSVDLNGSAYDMTSMRLDMTIKTLDEVTTIASFSTEGDTPAITIDEDILIIKADPLNVLGTFLHDLQVIDNTGAIMTILKGVINITGQIT